MGGQSVTGRTRGFMGLNSNEVAFTEHIASMDPATRQHSQSQISTGLAKLALNRYAQANEQRRLAIQAQANMSQQAATVLRTRRPLMRPLLRAHRLRLPCANACDGSTASE